MNRLYKIASVILISVMIFSTVNVVYADRTLTDKENAAFIKRPEWQEWVRAFTASLSEIDSKSTKSIYQDMDFYDLQYRFTSTYKIDETTKRTQVIRDHWFFGNKYDGETPDEHGVTHSGMTEDDIQQEIINIKEARGLL